MNEAERKEVAHNNLKDWVLVVVKTMFSPFDNVSSVDDSSEEKAVNYPQEPGNLETVNVDGHNEVEIIPTSAISLQTCSKPFEIQSQKCK